MRVEIWGPGGLPEMHVHAMGCADTERAVYRSLRRRDEGPWWIEATTREEVVKNIYPPDEFLYEPDDWASYADEIRFFPCTQELA